MKWLLREARTTLNFCGGLHPSEPAYRYLEELMALHWIRLSVPSVSSEGPMFRYYRLRNIHLRIRFDCDSNDAADASSCEVFDAQSRCFKRRDSILDEVLNDPSTVEITMREFLQAAGAQVRRSAAGGGRLEPEPGR